MRHYSTIPTLLVILFFCANLFGQVNEAKNHAIIIGIDDYQGIWSKLKNSKNDALALQKLLSEKYHFTNIHTLLNQEATRHNMQATLTSIANQCGENDQLLIFFSGHGYEKNNEGYWVPYDARINTAPTLVAHDLIKTTLFNSKCKNALLLTNAYFSDKIFKPVQNHTKHKKGQAYFNYITQLMSRQIIRSGGIQPILHHEAKHSIFGKHLIDILARNASIQLDAEQLFRRLKIPSTISSPNAAEFGYLQSAGHEGGQFVLRTTTQPICDFKVSIQQGAFVKIQEKGELTVKTNQTANSYEWRKEGLIIAKTKNLIVSESGTYKIHATAPDGCLNSDVINVEIIKTNR